MKSICQVSTFSLVLTITPYESECCFTGFWPPWFVMRNQMSSELFCKEKLFMTLVKHDKKRSIQEGTITMGFCSREERSASIPNTTKESEKL